LPPPDCIDHSATSGPSSYVKFLLTFLKLMISLVLSLLPLSHIFLVVNSSVCLSPYPLSLHPSVCLCLLVLVCCFCPCVCVCLSCAPTTTYPIPLHISPNTLCFSFYIYLRNEIKACNSSHRPPRDLGFSLFTLHSVFLFFRVLCHCFLFVNHVSGERCVCWRYDESTRVCARRVLLVLFQIRF
jgi:hypothetical protein